MHREPSFVARAHRTDRELFPAPKFGWDVQKYRDELDKQVQLKEVKKKRNRARDLLLEKHLLDEERRRENISKSIRIGNAENLMKTIYGGRLQSGSRHHAADNVADSFIQHADLHLREVPRPHQDQVQELPNKRDHIKANLTIYPERDDDIIRQQKLLLKDVRSPYRSSSTDRSWVTGFWARKP